MLTLAPAIDVKPKLVIAIGNPSRGDDALGPLLAERLEALSLPGVEVLTEFQLQVEHALDLLGRDEVVFVDASASGEAPCSFTPLTAAADDSITTHALSPAAVLEYFKRLTGAAPPNSFLLAVRGHHFELGAPVSASAAANLDAASVMLAERLQAALD